MRTFQTAIHAGIGDVIMAKAQIDPVKNNYDRIEISVSEYWLSMHEPNYKIFLGDLCKLLFSEPPYVLTEGHFPLRAPLDLHNQGFVLREPELGHLLCSGTPLNLGSEYIVLTTKVRYLSRTQLNNLGSQLWSTINSLSQKYKVVVLGERVVEMSPEYLIHTSEQIFGIYDDIIRNVSQDRLVDLTIPALGITSPNLKQFQQDCLIMRGAKFIMTLGVGGNFCMATATGNVVGYRQDNHDIFEIIYNSRPSKGVVTKDFYQFISALKKYL